MMSHKLDSKDSVQFMLAGNATFTARNRVTGKRFTFKIRRSKTALTPVHFVSVLYGSDNNADYTFFGTIFDEKTFVHSKKSTLKKDDIRVVGFKFIWEHLLANALNPDMEIWHEGSCGRCGRLLTVPESILSGYGPECIGLVGKTYKVAHS